MRKGRYYLGRVIKLGTLNQEKLIHSIRQSVTISFRSYNWTITEIHEGDVDNHQYIFGNLSKYAQEGNVITVDPERKSLVDASVEKLLRASSPFVYIPDYSGIAYLHVWNGIQEDVFRRRFKSIIEATFDNFFVDCTIEPIVDYRTFVSKVSKLQRFIEISATVHPPNPLFGRIWKKLNDYIRKRSVDEVEIKERKDSEGGIRSQIIPLINSILNDSSYEPIDAPDITDAALLMAADGYGRGKLIGEENDAIVTVSTSDNQKSFLFDKEPVIEFLVSKTIKAFISITAERKMIHGEED